jgi:hypothetical protein
MTMRALIVYSTIAAVICALFALAGCQGMGYNQAMSEAQIKAAVADKSASIVCSRVIAAGFTGETVILNLDQRVLQDGGIIIGDSCKTVEIRTAAPPKQQPPTK